MKNKDKLIIIGASGHGKVVADIALKMKMWDSIAFLDDNESISECLGFEVIGKLSDSRIYKDEADFFVAIGNNEIREKVVQKLTKDKYSVVSLIHPQSIIGLNVDIGIGTAIMGGAVINSSSKIGEGCIINTGSCLDHDIVLEDFVHVSPGVKVAGNVKIGKGTWLGIGCVVINNTNICKNCIIGAGAVIINHIMDSGTYIGLPARRIK